jgi:hypothetical protein
VELNELNVLELKTSSDSKASAVSGLGVGTGARLKASSVATGGNNCVMGSNSMNSTVSYRHYNDTSAFTILHYKVKNKIFDEKVAIIS